ncbi:protein ELF4-LIKE 4-like isoform X1 [Cornus florida]|uniref:protein ELF4-LIKE 4-like isoform X1 n=2 Tax=Cornus florida TaxID=4283 RepID=UPI0028A1A43E|nr:protein ELF4-LIKE 4-like isoform X1 [Cornus florida]
MIYGSLLNPSLPTIRDLIPLPTFPALSPINSLCRFSLRKINSFPEFPKMEGDIFCGIDNGTQVDSKVLQTFQMSFVQVQDILDQNKLIINEINQNHESKIPDNLTRNAGLIRELNSNIRRVVDLYADLSSSFANSMETSSEGDSVGTMKSDGKGSQKRMRSR